jgi:uncharacterized membrane protein required for colicin V production
MTWVDIIVVILLVLSFLGGLKEGAVRNFSSLLAIVIAIPLAGLAYRLIAGLLSFLPGTNWENFLGFYITLGIIYVIIYFIFFLPRKLVGAVWKKGILFRLLGGVLSLLGAIIWLVLFTLVVQAFPIFDWLDRWVSNSAILTAFVDTFGFVRAMLPEIFRRVVTTSV